MSTQGRNIPKLFNITVLIFYQVKVIEQFIKDSPGLIRRISLQSLLDPRSFIIQELLYSSFGTLMLFLILETFECGQIAIAGIFKRRDGQFGKFMLTCEGPRLWRIGLESGNRIRRCHAH